jgi:hypothetical protein
MFAGVESPLMQYAASHDLCENMVQVKELMARAVFLSSFVSRPDIPGCNTFHGLRPFSPSRLRSGMTFLNLTKAASG